jgi:hypothetical protein
MRSNSVAALMANYMCIIRLKINIILLLLSDAGIGYRLHDKLKPE